MRKCLLSCRPALLRCGMSIMQSGKETHLMLPTFLALEHDSEDDNIYATCILLFASSRTRSQAAFFVAHKSSSSCEGLRIKGYGGLSGALHKRCSYTSELAATRRQVARKLRSLERSVHVRGRPRTGVLSLYLRCRSSCAEDAENMIPVSLTFVQIIYETPSSGASLNIELDRTPAAMAVTPEIGPAVRFLQMHCRPYRHCSQDMVHPPTHTMVQNYLEL